MKKIIVTVCMMLFLMVTNMVFAREIMVDGVMIEYTGRPVHLMLNDEEFIPEDDEMAPIVLDNRVLVPVREVFEKLGGTVEWNASERSVSITFNLEMYEDVDLVANGEVSSIIEKNVIVLQIGDENAIVNGIKEQMDVPAKIINNKTMVPIRFVSEHTSFDVDWDEEGRIVRVSNTYPSITPIEEALVDVPAKDSRVAAEYCIPLCGDQKWSTSVIYGKQLKSGHIIVMEDQRGGRVYENDFDYSEEDGSYYDSYRIDMEFELELGTEYTVFLLDVIDKDGFKIESYSFNFKTELGTFSFVCNPSEEGQVNDVAELKSSGSIVAYIMGRSPLDVPMTNIIETGSTTEIELIEVEEARIVYEIYHNGEIFMQGSKNITDSIEIEAKEIIAAATEKKINVIGEEILVRVYCERRYQFDDTYSVQSHENSVVYKVVE